MISYLATIRSASPDSRMSASGALLQRLLALRPHQAVVILGAEHVVVQVGDPLPARYRHGKIFDRAAEMLGHRVPVKARIAVDQIGGRGIAELAVRADF